MRCAPPRTKPTEPVALSATTSRRCSRVRASSHPLSSLTLRICDSFAAGPCLHGTSHESPSGSPPEAVSSQIVSALFKPGILKKPHGSQSRDVVADHICMIQVRTPLKKSAGSCHHRTCLRWKLLHDLHDYYKVFNISHGYLCSRQVWCRCQGDAMGDNCQRARI